MEDKISGILEKIKQLEHELIFEIQKKEKEFFYEIKQKKIRFEKEIKKQHKLLIKKIRFYLLDAKFLTIITSPIVWSCLLPALFMDLVLTVFQSICFPIYRIPKVSRGDYIVLDRRYLSYLNWIEKMNCVYCGYFNGVVGYVQEIAARTEQHWCPIKHARKTKFLHNRYKNFFDYGDGEAYRKDIEKVRRDFHDLDKPDDPSSES